MKSTTFLNFALRSLCSAEAVILLLIVLTACSKSNDVKPVYPKNVTVEYRITSTTGITKVTSMSYTNASGGTTSLTDTPLPFIVRFDRTVSLGDDLGLSVLHNNSLSSSFFDLKLEIFVNNELVNMKTYEGTNNIIGAIVYLFSN